MHPNLLKSLFWVLTITLKGHSWFLSCTVLNVLKQPENSSNTLIKCSNYHHELKCYYFRLPLLLVSSWSKNCLFFLLFSQFFFSLNTVANGWCVINITWRKIKWKNFQFYFSEDGNNWQPGIWVKGNCSHRLNIKVPYMFWDITILFIIISFEKIDLWSYITIKI